MKKSLMVVYAYFPEDERLRREADALIKSGYEVSVLCLKYANEPKEEIVYGVKVFRLSMSSVRASKIKYIILYLSFFVRSFFKINSLYFKNKFDIIHIHNMPDFLVFLGLVPKIFGAKIILDLHDPSPEIFMTKFADKKDNLSLTILKWFEKVSIRFSNSVITTNKSFLDLFVLRGCPADKINIVMNTPQESIFNKFVDKNRDSSCKKKFVVMYHGSIVERHGLDILARAACILKNKIPGLKVIVFGEGEFVPKFIEEVKKLKIEDILEYFGKVSLDEIAETIPKIDVGVIPNRIGPFTQINFPVRIFEYLCNKKPVIVPRTQGIKDYFDEDSIFYFNAGDEEDLANVIFKIYSDPDHTLEVVNRGVQIYERYQWKNQSEDLVNIYKDVLA